MKDTITISEVFGVTLQGEGAFVGRPTVFVRTGGCDLRCRWCDSLHAVLPEYRPRWEELTASDIILRVESLTRNQPVLITVSGGNPALQPLEAFLDTAHEREHMVALETQGTVAPAWLSKLDYLILSPKPPSSGMKFAPARLAACIHQAKSPAQGRCKRASISLKVVVMTEEDYLFAREIYDEFAAPNHVPFFITPGNHTPPSRLLNSREEIVNDGEIDLDGIKRRTEWILERCTRDAFFDVSIIMQQHTILWGNRAGV